jgi:hypothetical protein
MTVTTPSRKAQQNSLNAGDEVLIFWGRDKNARARIVKASIEGGDAGCENFMLVEWISEFVPKEESTIVWFERLR